MEEILTPAGIVYLKIEWDDGRVEYRETRNRILMSGRANLAKALANEFGLSFDYFITGISFGSGGTVGGAPRYVDDTRNGLFGPLVTTAPVISSINSQLQTQVTFTSVLTFDQAVGNVINEMALLMGDGNYFSMCTMPDLNKTVNQQYVFNWRLTFV